MQWNAWKRGLVAFSFLETRVTAFMTPVIPSLLFEIVKTTRADYTMSISSISRFWWFEPTTHAEWTEEKSECAVPIHWTVKAVVEIPLICSWQSAMELEKHNDLSSGPVLHTNCVTFSKFFDLSLSLCLPISQKAIYSLLKKKKKLSTQWLLEGLSNTRTTWSSFTY